MSYFISVFLARLFGAPAAGNTDLPLCFADRMPQLELVSLRNVLAGVASPFTPGWRYAPAGSSILENIVPIYRAH